MKVVSIVAVAFVSIAILVIVVSAPKASVQEETAAKGLKSILALYKAREFDQLIRERYSEIYKAQETGKVDVLIEKFSQRFSAEKQLNEVVVILESFVGVEPEVVTNPNPRVTETDKMAKFPMEQGEFTLYLQKTGKWGFHM